MSIKFCDVKNQIKYFNKLINIILNSHTTKHKLNKQIIQHIFKENPRKAVKHVSSATLFHIKHKKWVIMNNFYTS